MGGVSWTAMDMRFHWPRLCIPPEFRGIPLNSFLLDLKGTESCFPFRGMQKGTRREIPSVTKSYEIVSGGARPPGNGPSRKEHQRILTNIRGRTRLSIYRTGQDNGTSTASRSPAVRARRGRTAGRPAGEVHGPPAREVHEQAGVELDGLGDGRRGGRRRAALRRGKEQRH